MAKMATEIDAVGLQVLIHAMGDKAIDAALSTIEQVQKSNGDKVLRCRIEQAAVLREELLERMKKEQVIVSIQPRVVASEFSVWSALKRLGSRRTSWLFPLKSLVRNGICVVAGSDCPMEPLNPMIGIQAAVCREVFPEQRLSVLEALRMYTIDAAYASGEEKIKGSIEQGKLADITVLSEDPLSVSPSKIGLITSVATIIGGRVSYPP